MTHQHHLEDLALGEPQGTAPSGTVAYSNNDRYPFSGVCNHDGNFFTGYQWQCVEFARRWLWDTRALMLPDVHIASQIFFAPHVYDPIADRDVPVRAFLNGSAEKPKPDTLLIYKSDLQNFPGHVAVIVEVGEDYVRVCDQNRTFSKWPGNYTVQLELKRTDGKWSIIDTPDPVLGWVDFVDAPAAPILESHAEATWTDEGGVRHARMRRPLPEGFTKVPDYSPSVKRMMLLGAMMHFHPHPIVFPYMIAKTLLQASAYVSIYLARAAVRRLWGAVSPPLSSVD